MEGAENSSLGSRGTAHPMVNRAWALASGFLAETAEDTDSQTSTNPRQCEGPVGRRTEESQVSYKVSQRC